MAMKTENQIPGPGRRGVFIRDHSDGAGSKINQEEIEQARKDFLLKKEQSREAGDPK